MTAQDVSDRLKTRIARFYYLEGMTQDEIVTLTGLNRTKVLRILAASCQDGTVQIRVTSNISKCVDLERALEARWNRTRAIAIPEPQHPTQMSAILGATLGAFISETLSGHSTIGLGRGKTLSSALPALEPRQAENMRVLSLLGGLTHVSSVNPSEFAWRFADRLNADCHLLTAPFFAPDRLTKEALLDHPGIAEIFAQAKNLDMAVVSVGALNPQSVFYDYGLLSRTEIASLQAAGAVGDILCHFVNQDGELIEHPVNERVLAVNPAQLRNTRNVVLVSWGLAQAQDHPCGSSSFGAQSFDHQ